MSQEYDFCTGIVPSQHENAISFSILQAAQK